ncbi:hypothetical protein A3Q56_05199 [Intoshia linei]|uniref:Uncharacterized protein n=1 Tax=Intoshia linei TaxID=1819745 RepID=A0A177AYJ7_9BILA|nr:hypothetical protein A3Q56_05199 [Intoshia linei]
MKQNSDYDQETPSYVAEPVPATTIVMNQSRPENYLVLAIIVAMCCNALFGVIAVIYSILSNGDADRNNIIESKRKAKLSLKLSIAGIVIGVITIIFVIVYYTVLAH